MTGKEVREKFLKFFKGAPRSHVEISPAPLVLENDPTTLFTSSGMQPLVLFLMGESHPNGKRLVDSQPSLRTTDIDEVGDNRHLTFLEMLGNWSLGDYFKKEQLPWFYEFLTKELELDKEKIWVSVFEGNEQVPRDEESAEIWRSLGITEERIHYYGVEKNWWSRSGTPEQMRVGEIGGPDSEVFYDFGKELGLHDVFLDRGNPCHPNCECGRFLEIGNSVFMQYKKVGDGKLEELPQRNVDFGGGLERLTAATINNPDVFATDLFKGLIELVGKNTHKDYDSNMSDFRVIADHVRAAVFLADLGITPSNKEHGYVLRRLIRRACVKLRQLKGNLNNNDFSDLVGETYKIFSGVYLNSGVKNTLTIIEEEVDKFIKTLDRGLKELGKLEQIDARVAFNLYQSYGFPLEITKELAEEKGQKLDLEKFKKEFDKHKDLSRTTSAGVFKGGLADHSPEVVKLHTATHLLLTSLREVLGEHVVQKGQNITKERSRFDFPNPEKLTDDQLQKVENFINGIINKDLPIKFEVMPKDQALATGAIHAFNEKYTDTVKIYYVGEELDDAISREFCGGPHVTHTGEIGSVKIKKQEKIGSGIIRLYIILNNSEFIS
ncbi:hypothetical protein A3E41_04585 [Candidatus Woesebacteria bacterium RIFCSPHIGHO2_12_FULL_38_9]|nr:MAG: hypothetical protein A3E41_04585 [Candidatus Woesebacteria bacterium RIFCSPHIGHO2_12_FULL_38_9]